MQLYSFEGRWPQPLPWEIFVPDPDRPGESKSRTDPATFTEDEIADAGGVAVADPPPIDPDYEVLGWDGVVWAVTERPLATVQAERRQAATDKRWEVETGGITLAGSLVRTDRESQGMIAGARTLAMVDPDEPVEFKAASGWVTLDSATVIAIGTAVGRHVRACFRRERELHDAIDAASSIAALRLIDIASGWPG